MDCSGELAACDARVKAGDVSWHHQAHVVISAVVFLSLVLAQLVLAHAFHKDERWRRLRTYSAISAVATLVLLVIYAMDVVQDSGGLMQRIFLAVPLVWIAVLGLRVLRHFAGTTASPVPVS